MDAESLLDGLNQQQLDAVTMDRPTVVVMAAAGSGKTRVITRRIAWRLATGQVNPDRVIAVTFTRRAAQELRYRQRQLGLRDNVTAGTFHRIALDQLRKRWAEQNRSEPKIVSNKRRLINRVANELKVTTRSATTNGSGQDLVAEIDWARARLISADDYPTTAALAKRTPAATPEQVSAVMKAYQQLKNKKRVVDFDDLLLMALTALRHDPSYATAIQWKYQNIYVDEFQDINPLQFELLQAWRGDDNQLFVVGDPNQAIFGWNGADPHLLESMATNEPDVAVVQLTENYRSSPHILRLAETACSNPVSAPTASRSGGLPPTLTALPTAEAEADHIATTILERRSMGRRWSDQTVLTRTNQQLEVIADTLRDRGVECRHQVGDSPLRDRNIGSDLKALTASEVDLAAWVEQQRTEQNNWEPDGASTADRRQQVLLQLVADYVETDDNPSAAGLSSWVGLLGDADVASGDDAVDLTTFHSAKGLEWPIVHVAGLEAGYVPSMFARTADQHNEEQRLLYVALTRAEDELHLTWARQRRFNNRVTNRTPSPFAGALATAIAKCAQAEQRNPHWKQGLQHSRAQLTNQPPSDQATSDAYRKHQLERWRAAKARANAVTEQAVLADDNLDAIAQSEAVTSQVLANVGLSTSFIHRFGSELVDLFASDAR